LLAVMLGLLTIARNVRKSHESAKAAPPKARRDPDGLEADLAPLHATNLDWDLLGQASRQLAQQVAESGYQPTIVVAVARGGLVPAAAIAYALGVKRVFTVSVETHSEVDQLPRFPVMLHPRLDPADLTGADVLVADDMADTGATLRLVTEFCLKHAARCRCAVLYKNTHSAVNCDYAWLRTSFTWPSPAKDFAKGRRGPA